jgi:hypothetical protein
MHHNPSDGQSVFGTHTRSPIQAEPGQDNAAAHSLSVGQINGNGATKA